MGKKLRNATLGLTMAGIVAGGLTSCSETENKQPTKKNNKTEQAAKPLLNEMNLFRSVCDGATSYNIITNDNGSTVYVAEYKLTPEQKQQAQKKLQKLEKLKKTILEKENPKLHQAAREGDLQSVQAALEKGANINSIDPETGMTAIQEALSCPNFAKASRIATLLVENPQIEVGQAVKDEINNKIIAGDRKWQYIQDKLSIAKKTQPTVLEQINSEIEQTKRLTDDITLYGYVTKDHSKCYTLAITDKKYDAIVSIYTDVPKFDMNSQINNAREGIRNKFSLNQAKIISNGITWEEALRNQQQASL